VREGSGQILGAICRVGPYKPMLALRPNCELCDVDLPPEAANARICSYECTFCADGFAPRPIRPARAWRDGTGLANDPPDTNRRSLRYSMDGVLELVEKIRDVPPAER
jgi:hypothetical protein